MFLVERHDPAIACMLRQFDAFSDDPIVSAAAAAAATRPPRVALRPHAMRGAGPTRPTFFGAALTAERVEVEERDRAVRTAAQDQPRPVMPAVCAAVARRERADRAVLPPHQFKPPRESERTHAARFQHAHRILTPQNAGPWFRRNLSSCGIQPKQNQSLLTDPDLKPTPAWLGGLVRWRRAIKKKPCFWHRGRS